MSYLSLDGNTKQWSKPKQIMQKIFLADKAVTAERHVKRC